MSPKSKDFPDEGPKRRVMVGAIGACVHNLGVEGFADWMADKGIGYVSVKLGPAVPIPDVINKIREARPEVVGISMRLGDLHIDKLTDDLLVSEHELPGRVHSGAWWCLRAVEHSREHLGQALLTLQMYQQQR